MISDKDIILQIKVGKIDYFSYIVRRYSGKIIRYVKAKVFNKDDVDDRVQNIFFSFYKSISRFDESRPIGPYLYQIARNELKMYYRSHKATKSLQDDHESLSYEQSYYFNEHKDLISLLSKEQRNILELLQLGFTYQEIAKKITRPINTVRTIIRRMRLQLKKHYETT